MPGLALSVRSYRIALAVLFIAAIALRLPAVFQDLPPYTFCDEDIYANEAYRMYQAGTWRTVEFRSGAFNIYPILFIASMLPPLSHLEFVFVGRIFYAVVLSAATVLVIAAATKTLFGRRDVALVAALGFVISPTAIAISRYWYPDHYLVFFSALMLFWLARLISGQRSWIEYVALGATWALGLSVKYSFAFVAIAILITLVVVWRQRDADRGIRAFFHVVVVGGLVILASTIVTLCLVNFSAFFDLTKFQKDFLFNFENYGRAGSSISGIAFYGFLLFGLTLGAAGVAGFVVGTTAIIRSAWPKAVLLLGFPVVLIAYLGLQGLVINRNMYIAFAFVLPVFGLGIVVLLERIARLPRAARVVAAAAVAVAMGAQLAVVGVITVKDLQPDSRVLAEEWINETVPATATIGMNEFCSGPSPAYDHEKVAFDSQAVAGYDYYVMNSYWDSLFNPAYRGRGAIGFTLDQEYLHYYYFNDRGLPWYYISQLFTPRVTPDQLVPQGYEIAEIFSSNGPDIIVLRRLDDALD
jgi:4-amino-4-deoxy-L-arabinose transferase-like glycosyltransferase